MNCKNVQTRLQAFLDGDLPEIEAKAVEQHLGRCLPCARLKRDFLTLTDLARQELRVKSPENFERVLGLRLKTRNRQTGRWSFAAPSFGWSAAALVALGLFLMSGLFLGPMSPTEGRSAAVLPDSSGPVVVPSDPETPHAHLWVPKGQEDQEGQDGTLVQIPPTVTITRQHLTQDFFLTEISH